MTIVMQVDPADSSIHHDFALLITDQAVGGNKTKYTLDCGTKYKKFKIDGSHTVHTLSNNKSAEFPN